MWRKLRRLFDLRQDQNDFVAVDADIRAGVAIGGTNLWVLIFAILIASVGLNVNSTAVIIGAMLISPLMRPILGIGYGAAIGDYRLIRAALYSLSVFVALSLVTSTLYFLASPLSQAQAELLARTTPTIWDVLIAFFGGCAGIVAQTRRDESTVIPGAAIATALMPPLCTAGFGLATRQWDFVWGAFYLFSINAFFIGLATSLFVSLLRFPRKQEADPATQRRARLMVALAVIVMAVPSGFLAYRLVQDQVFLARSKDVVRELEAQPGTIVLTREVSAPRRRVVITLGGTPPAPGVEAKLAATLRQSGFDNATLVLRTVGSDKVDVASLREELRHDLFSSTVDQLAERDARLKTLDAQLAALRDTEQRHTQIVNETLAQYPAIARMSIANAAVVERAPGASGKVLLIVIEARPALSGADLTRIEAGLAVRLPGTPLRLLQLP